MSIELGINGEMVNSVDEDELIQFSRHLFSFLGFFSFVLI